MRLTFYLLLATAALGCRDFRLPPPPGPPPAPPLKSAGSPCADAAQCQDGFCQDGVCCERSCAASELCNLPSHVGACMDRPLGSTCAADAECPTGFCTDGVCCSERCDGLCRTCAGEGKDAGKCLKAPDNSDARRECGICYACVQGQCGPAQVGSDPNQSCPAGQVCGPGQNCGLPGDAACARDDDCAVGWCIESRCLEATAERIVPGGMLVLPDMSRVQAVAANGAGDIAVGIVEWAENELGSPVFEDFYSMVRSRTGAWHVANDTVVPQFSGQTAPGVFACDLVYWDSRLFVAQYQDCPPPCGVFGQLFSETLQAGPLETIDSTRTMWLRLGIDSKKRIVVAHEEWNDSEYKFHLYVERRDALPGQPPSWTSLLAQPMVVDNFQFLVVGGRPLILVFDDGALTLTLHWLDPEEIGDSMHMPCLESYPAVGTFSDPAGEGFVLAADCSETSWRIVTWRPQPPPPNRWTVGTPQEMSSVTVVSGASQPMIAALVKNDDGYFDAVIQWHEPGETWGPGTGQSRAVVASRGLTYVHNVIAAADPGGAPIVVVGTSQKEYEPDPADFTLVRFHP